MEIKEIKVSEFTRHVALYAKGHYKKSERIADLKTIIGIIAGMDKEYVDMGNVYSIIMQAFLEFSALEPYNRDQFWLELFPKHQLREGRTKMTVNDFLGYILGFIACAKVCCDKYKIYLGEPDAKILPLSK